MKNIIEQINDKIEDMECLEEAWGIQNEINELHAKGKITGKEWEDLHSNVLFETQFKDFELVSIDDYDWELMKESDPNLSDQ